MLSLFCRVATVVLVLVASGSAGAVDGPATVNTPGSGTLTMCRSWLLFSTCRNYNNVELPARVALGDKLPLNFGSNPKDYEFPVRRIVRSGDTCTLLSDISEAGDRGNKIEVSSCGDASGSH